VAIATPGEYYAPDPVAIGRAHDLSRVGHGTIEVGTDPYAAVKGADVVYTDAWISVDDVESQHPVRRELLAPYRVNDDLMAEAAPSAVFLHALPAHRGEEVTSEVLDGPRSIVADQIAHGTPTAQAVLLALAEGRLEGR
jgi:ornithine carbamoyltransferase